MARRRKAVRLKGKTIRQVLPAALRDRLYHVHRDIPEEQINNFLSWPAGSAVGRDCLRVARLASQFDRKLDSVVDSSGIWFAAAHQCLIYAYS